MLSGRVDHTLRVIHNTRRHNVELSDVARCEEYAEKDWNERDLEIYI